MTTAHSVIIHFAILLLSLCIFPSSTAQQHCWMSSTPATVKEISLEISYVVAVSCTVHIEGETRLIQQIGSQIGISSQMVYGYCHCHCCCC